MNSRFIISILSVLVWVTISTQCAATISVYEAGPRGKAGPVLTDGMTFCPSSFSSRGISIHCAKSLRAKNARFFVNGSFVKFERNAPFFINGNEGSTVTPWHRVPKGQVSLVCIQNDGTRSSANVIFSCSQQTPSPSPSSTPLPSPSSSQSPDLSTSPITSVSIDGNPGEMNFQEAGRDGLKGPVLKDGMTFCPKMFPSEKFSIFCAQSDTSRFANFFIDDVIVRKEKAKPYYIRGDRDGFIRPWKDYPKNFEVRCRLSDGSSSSAKVRISCEEPETPRIEPTITTTANGCVVIDARLSPLSEGWTETVDGLEFRAGNRSGEITEKGVSPLMYSFVPPVSSRYAFVLDMTTRQKTEHNDVWARWLDGGFSLMRHGVVFEKIEFGLIKVFHNAKGRAAISSSVDGEAHSISTANVLLKERMQTFYLGGRSTRVIVHRIILFPCEGRSCERRNPEWKKRLRECNPATTL